MKYSGAEITIKLLEEEGISIIPGIPGGANLPLYSALAKSGIRHILARHEQGAGFIAQGMARSTGRPAVCFATSGPGATNLLTAIADAKMDSVPLIAITGQVSSGLIGTDAFQEVDTYGMSIPVTKHNFLIRSAGELERVIPEAFRIASEGRPGPVLIDMPKDVQLEKVEAGDLKKRAVPEEKQSGMDTEAIKRAARMINGSAKPVIYAGGGIIASGAGDVLRRLSRRNSIPVASTLMGLGCISSSEEMFLGMFGMHGSAHANSLMHEADLVLVFGARFDDRATGNPGLFCPGARIIHIDIDGAEINKIKKADIAFRGDIRLAIEALLPLIEDNDRRDWKKTVLERKRKLSCAGRGGKIEELIKKIALFAGEDAIITTDVGQHQMWVAQYYPFSGPRTFLTSGGLGTMGFGLPAAIGAGLANPGKKIICFTGDGSFLMNMQEMSLLSELGLDIKIVLLNNRRLGMVRQQQEYFYGGEYIASSLNCRTDFARIAEAFGIEGKELKNSADRLGEMEKVIKETGPALINIPVDPWENVTPTVIPGRSNNEMIGGEGHERGF
ncbi:MAG TPA: biosynthetic-type acetolactate synthase large subunit [Candidatus Omnitrophota bacterium]|nr:biosynthetic-type acetolactate synthase large subunit [Candidatus Omnitrophota bacterium]